jgi:hypothetical protein
VTRPVLLPRPRHAAFTGARVQPVGETEITRSSALPHEGYELEIADGGAVRIAAADDAGVFHAHATLDQCRRPRGEGLPVGMVRDWPDLPVRGVMLDISRDKVPTMETLFALVDRLASWKVNQLQLYTEHTFAYAGHEEAWRDASPITAEEIRTLDAYCAERFVSLVPNQNCLGHMGRWLRHDRYRDLAMAPEGFTDVFGRHSGPTTIEPTNPGSLALVRDLLGQLLPNFSNRSLVHVGLDEPWEMPDERIGDYLDWVRTLRALPEVKGRELLVWGDILGGDPERIGALPDGVTVCEWGYDDSHPFDARAAAYQRAGRPFWVAPGTSSWLTILGRVTNMRGNCANAVDAALLHGGSGMLNTDWGDLGHLQYLPISEPGLAYGAAVAWCLEENRDLDLAAALDAHCYGDDAGELGEVLCALGDLHLEITPQLGNISTLVLHLYYPQLRFGTGLLAGVTVEEMDTVLALLDRCREALGRARPERPDGSLVLDELRNGIALVQILARDGRERLQGDGRLESIPASVRAELATELGEVIEEHRRLWLARNRPGGLKDSCRWPEHLRDCYESGTTERSWGSE